MTSKQTEKRLAIVGGGLAGMAAAAAAVERGFRVELFEKTKCLGGRAGSFVDRKTGDTVDFCQHLAMGCCTEFLDFCRRTGIDDCFDRHETMHFIGPDGRQCDIAPCRWLPPPLHLLPGLMRMDFLSRRERWEIARAMRKLTRLDATRSEYADTAVGPWLYDQRQTPLAIERFWSVVLESALSETADRASLAAAQKVFRDGFWASREACALWLPRGPLSKIFHNRIARWLADRGVELQLGTAVKRIVGDGRRAQTLILSDGTRRAFDAAIVAVPWQRVRRLFDENLMAAMPALAEVERIEPAAITAVHLWFDRPITLLPHAVVVGPLGLWVFTQPSSHYCQAVVSASHRHLMHGRKDWLRLIPSELAMIWPTAREARLLHGRAITHRSAVFSVTPKCERLRQHLTQRTPVENLCLAGDWTATCWPATMEGAVRSGRQAVEAIVRS